MKNFFLLLFTASTLGLSAQSGNGVGEGIIRYGVSLKGHQSNIRGIHDVSKPRYGGAAGVFMEIPFAQRIASTAFVQPQVEYAMEGEEADPSTGRQKFHNDYINALVYVKYFFGGEEAGKEPTWFAMLGPKIGFNVSRKTSGEITFPADIRAEDSFKKTNIGISLGGGYRFSRNVEAFVRYDNGFTPVYEDYRRGTFGYQLGLGINAIFK